jgi:signal transduction histidine kinase
MLHKLKKHLVLIYTASTGAILIAVMIVVYLLNISEQQKHSMERFLMTADALANKLQTSPMLSVAELATMEVENEMIIHIEDNGIPISFTGSYHSKTEREALIQQEMDASRLEGVNVDVPPTLMNVRRSSITKITGEAGDEYYGCTIIIPLSPSYRSITLLYSLSNIDTSLRINAFIFIVITVIGILLLFLISYHFIDRTLYPIKESNQKQVEFVASASHELRSPLAYMQASTGALKTDCLPFMPDQAKEVLREYIENANEEFQRMSALIEDMLLLASADTNTWPIHIAPTDGDAFLIESYDTLSRFCIQHDHELNLDLPDEFLGEINIDPHRIYQILQILINNANSYTPAKSCITISAYKAKKQLTIEVIDHGSGIPDAEKSRVFDRYYRSDKSRNDKSHFGLGLTIAKELAHLHHGVLTLRDTVGGGCTFQIMIPMK